MKVTEISGSFGGLKITNQLWQCDYCNEQSNSLEWFVECTKSEVKFTCPECLQVEVENSDSI